MCTSICYFINVNKQAKFLQFDPKKTQTFEMFARRRITIIEPMGVESESFSSLFFKMSKDMTT
jgi:hypothetical protein